MAAAIKQRIARLVLPHLPWQLLNFEFDGTFLIEPTNKCNLKCPLCPTAQAMEREKGCMSFRDFKTIVDEVVDISERINMNFAGEPLLNKDIFRMTKYAERKGIETLISTNATFPMENFIGSLKKLIVCLDGATAGTHERYRVGSNFEKVKENIRRVCEEKYRRDSEKPLIVFQFLVMKHNEHEMNEMIRLAKGLGVDALTFKTISLGSWITSDERTKLSGEYLPSKEHSRYLINRGKVEVKKAFPICQWLRKSVILWDGNVTMCCYDFNGELVIGNVFENGSFKDLWKSKEYRRRRKEVIRKKFDLCKNCAATSLYNVRTIDFRGK